MAEQKITVKYNPDKTPLSEREFQPRQKYKLVSSKDVTIANVNFKKDVPVEMTGLLALNCIKRGGGLIKRYNEDEKQREDEINDRIQKAVEKAVSGRVENENMYTTKKKTKKKQEESEE